MSQHRDTGPRAPRQGMVLLLALLCLLALEVTAVGVHFIVLQELRTARAVGRTAQLRLAAQAAVARGVTAWPPPGLREIAELAELPVPAASGTMPGGITFSASFERLSDDLLMVRGVAESPLRERARAGVLLALAQPDLLAAAARAAIVTTGSIELLPGSLVRGSDGGPAPADSAAAPSDMQTALPCTSPGSSPAALTRDSASVVRSGGTVIGALATADPADGMFAARLATIAPAWVARFATAIPVEAISPFPMAGMEGCETGRFDSWGEPGNEVAACMDFHPILHRTGDLTISGGRGQGILVVDGNLVMDGGRFDGIVLVSGAVQMRQGAAANGIVMAQGDVRIEHSTVTFDRCAIAAAFRDFRVRGPFRTAGRTWIPLF